MFFPIGDAQSSLNRHRNHNHEDIKTPVISTRGCKKKYSRCDGETVEYSVRYYATPQSGAPLLYMSLNKTCVYSHGQRMSNKNPLTLRLLFSFNIKHYNLLSLLTKPVKQYIFSTWEDFRIQGKRFNKCEWDCVARSLNVTTPQWRRAVVLGLFVFSAYGARLSLCYSCMFSDDIRQPHIACDTPELITQLFLYAYLLLLIFIHFSYFFFFFL